MKIILSAILFLLGAGLALAQELFPLQAVPVVGSATVTVNGQSSGVSLVAGSQFSVGWSGAPGDASNWLGICPASGTPYPSSCDATQHYWVSLACYPWEPAEGGRTVGGCGAMTAPMVPGNYQITMYDTGGPGGGQPTTSINGGYGNILGYATFTVTAAPPPSGSNYGKYLLGGDIDSAGYTNFVNALAIQPQIEGCGNANCAPDPMHYALPFILKQSDAAAAAASTDGSFFTSYLNYYSGAFPYTYFIRICNEWQGNGNCGPFINADENAGEAISPATWIAGVRNYIAAFKKIAPNMKFAMDVPYTAEQAKYWPGNDVIDIVTYDIYTGNGSGGPGSVASWNYIYDNFLTKMLSYNKPMAFPEFCDKFPDGYFVTQMANFMNTHNVVAFAWWNVPGWGGNQPYGEFPCQLDATTDKLAAYQNFFKNYQYTGGTSFWPVIIPWQ